MPGSLAQLADLKAHLDQPGPAQDARLLGLLRAASSDAEWLAGRPLRRQMGRMELPDRVGDMDVHVQRPPIETIASLRVHGSPNASWADFEGDDELVEDEDYEVGRDTRSTLIALGHFCWPRGHRQIRLIYTGGYADPGDVAGGDLPP